MFFEKPRKFLSETMSAMAISQMILRIPNAAREIPRRISVTPQTVSNWIEGKTQPNATNLVALMAEFDEVTTEVLRMAGKRTLTDAQMRAARDALQLLVGDSDDTSP